MANTFESDLGKVTAYAYAVDAGYQGTEAEFEEDLLNAVSTFVTDKTLAVEDKAADAKATGEAIEAVGESFTNYVNYIVGTANLIDSVAWTKNKYIGADGGISSSQNYQYSDLIGVNAGEQYYLVINRTDVNVNTRIHAYDNNGDWIEQIAVINSGATAGIQSIQFVAPDCTYIRISTGKTFDVAALKVGAQNIANTINGISALLNYYDPYQESIGGLTLTPVGNGIIILNGSAASNITFAYKTVIPAGTYKAKISIKSGSTTANAIALRYETTDGSALWITGTSSETEKTFAGQTPVFFRANAGEYTNYRLQITIIDVNKDVTAVDNIARAGISALETEIADIEENIESVGLANNKLSLYNAFTCVNKNDIKLSDSTKILAFGDSITHGGTGWTSWVTHLCNIIGCTNVNKAVAGSLYGESVRTSDKWISTQLASVSEAEWDEANLIIVAAGTNDAGYDTTDIELKAKVQSTIDTIKNNTDAPILFITPIKRGNAADNEQMGKLPYISGIIENIALINKCSVICGLNFPIPSFTIGVIDGMMASAIHPTDDGEYIYAMSVINAIM